MPSISVRQSDKNHFLDRFRRRVKSEGVKCVSIVVLLVNAAIAATIGLVWFVVAHGELIGQTIGFVLGILILLSPHILLYLFAVHKVRRLRLLIYFTVWLGPIVYLLLGFVVLAIEEGTWLGPGIAGLFVLLFVGLPWFIIGRFVADFITPLIMGLLVHRITCPACREWYEVADVYRCGCGYVDHRPRSIVMWKCPLCKKRIGHIPCQRCDVSILI